MLKRSIFQTYPDAAPPRDLMGWMLVAVSVYSWIFISPFVFKFFFWELNRPLKLLAYGSVLLVFLRSGVDRTRLAQVLENRTVFLFLLLFGAYMLVLTVSSVMGYGKYTSWLTGVPHDPLPNLVGAWLLVAVSFVFIVYADLRLYRWLLDRFTDMMLLCSIGAIVLTPLLYHGLIEPLAKAPVVSEGAQLVDEWISHLSFYGLGFHRDYAEIAGFRFPRAQSFAHEGAGFAYPLLMAMIWALWRGRRLAFALMVPAFVLTWSIGAFAFCLLMPTFYLLRKPVLGLLLLTGLAGAYLLLVLTGVFDPAVLDNYLAEKLDSSSSSLAGRLQDWRLVTNAVYDLSVLGFGAGAAQFVFPLSIPTSLIAPFAQAGMPGLLCWVAAYFVLAIKAGRLLFKGDPESSALALMIVLLLFQSLQTPAIDATLFGWFFVAIFISRLCQLDARTQASSRLDAAPAFGGG